MARRRRSPAPSSESNQDGSARSAQDKDTTKSKKPANTAFRQQRLRAWQPVLTPRTIIVVWSVLAIVLLAVGGVLFWLSTTVRDFALEYTTCQTEAPSDDFRTVPSKYIVSHFTTSGNNTAGPGVAQWRRATITQTFDGVPTQLDQCLVRFNIPEDLAPPVMMYYKLKNFYQNHRRYVISFSADQLKGTAVSASTLNTSNCEQLHSDPAGSGKPIYPCGLIANSLFNDTYTSPVLLNPKNTQASNKTYIMLNNTNIAWASEADLYGQTAYKNDEIVPPPNWKKQYPNGYTANNPPPNLKTWQHFQNWMRTAATADFTKAYQRNDNATMEAGTYQLDIVDNFNVTAFDGHKYFVISTLCALGGRNPWIGIIFLVTGGFCLIMTIVFSVGHLLRPRKMGDHTYLSWNDVPNAGAGGATGATTGAEAGRGVGARHR